MSSLNDSVLIIKHFCYKCEKAVELLDSAQNCGECGTGFIEEIAPTPSKTTKIKENGAKFVLTPEEFPKPSEVSECSICLQQMHDNCEPIVRLVCSHAYHKPCLKDWLKLASNCPLCRGKVDVPSVVTPIRRPQLATRGHTRGNIRYGFPLLRHVRSRSPVRPVQDLISFDTPSNGGVGHQSALITDGSEVQLENTARSAGRRIRNVRPVARLTNRRSETSFTLGYPQNTRHPGRGVEEDHLWQLLNTAFVTTSEDPNRSFRTTSEAPQPTHFSIRSTIEDNWVFPNTSSGSNVRRANTSN